MNQVAVDNFLRSARRTGCTADQVRHFLLGGYVPQPKQMEFHAQARLADFEGGPEHIALGGARGPGKSHAIMAQIALDDCLRHRDLNCLFVRKVGKAAKESLDQLRKKTFINVPHGYNRQEGIIRFHETGSTIVVGHFQNEGDIDNYVSLEYDIIAIEEDTQLSKAKKQMLLGSLRTSKPGWRPRTYRSTNPGGVGHQDFKQQFVMPWRAGRETLTRFIPATYKDNVFLNKEYIRYLEGLTGILGRMWRDGDWDIGAGMFFVNWNYDIHVIKPRPIHYQAPVWAGFDYGFTHPTAVHWFAAVEGAVYTIAEHFESRWLPKQHAPRLKTITRKLDRDIDDLRFAAGHDAFAQGKDKDGKTVAEQYEEQGVILTRANIDRLAGAAEMLNRLGNPEADVRPTWFIFDTCPRLIETIPAMLSDPHRAEDVLKVDADDEGNGGDDPYDSARYGLMERPLGRGRGGFQVPA